MRYLHTCTTKTVILCTVWIWTQQHSIALNINIYIYCLFYSFVFGLFWFLFKIDEANGEFLIWNVFDLIHFISPITVFKFWRALFTFIQHTIFVTFVYRPLHLWLSINQSMGSPCFFVIHSNLLAFFTHLHSNLFSVGSFLFPLLSNIVYTLVFLNNLWMLTANVRYFIEFNMDSLFEFLFRFLCMLCVCVCERKRCENKMKSK